jgi:hypothetical protein
MQAEARSFREGRLSPVHLGLGQIWRTIVTGNHGTVASILAVLAILVPVTPPLAVYVFRLRGVPEVVKLGLLILFAVLVSSLCVFVVCSLALKSMPPHDYARITIGGRPPSEVLQVISRKIKGACKNSLDAEDDLTKPNPTREVIDKLKNAFATQHRALLNISALMELASEELDIPLPRLRDYIFEYDPIMHRKYFQKAIANSELLSEVNNQSRQSKLVGENKRIFELANGVLRSQEAILAFTALHSRILQVAATRSTSDATGGYARAVEYVARELYKAKPDPSKWRRRQKERVVHSFEALAFLVRKQRAHPGFDLHQSCSAAWREAISEAPPIASREQIGSALRTLKEELKNKKLKGVLWVDELENMRKLTETSLQIDVGFVNSGNQLVDSFRELHLGWCRNDKNNDQKTLLVTHGYSSTVREVLLRGLLSKEEAEKKLKRAYEIPNVFVVNSGEKGDLDSRWMVRELLAGNVPEQTRFANLTVGHEDVLAGFLDKNTRVMVVLGAECFDVKGRVIHPWGLNHHGFRQKLQSAMETCVVVVAEGYKFHDDLLSVSEAYRYHLDRIRLYAPEFVDVFVTTKIIMRQEPDRRQQQQPPPGKERRDPTGRADHRDHARRCRHILRRPWEQPTVKKHAFDLVRV